MLLTWKDAKIKYPNKWVVFKNPQYTDKFHMDFIGGDFVGIADDQEEMFKMIPDIDDGHSYVPRHTREDEAVGLLKSGF